VRVFSIAICTEVIHTSTPRALYTTLAAEFGFEVCAEWWFGSDAMDLYRSILVQSERMSVSAEFSASLDSVFKPLIDSLQLEIDKAEVCSEVHMLWKKIL
jgi:hypothetical protein